MNPKLAAAASSLLLLAAPVAIAAKGGAKVKAGAADAGTKADAGAIDAGSAAAPKASTLPDGGAAPAMHVEVPSAAEAKKVIDYYYHGQEHGPLLVELRPCLKVEQSKEGPTKSDCVEPVSGPVKKGTVVNAWTLWIVPEGGNYDDVILQWLLDGTVRSTTDLKLTTAFRSRTWRPQALHKAGKWEVKVVRGEKTLGSATINVEN